ncbi:hypothetical protein PM082_004372 [Marasmius tenuissimus]|nr:hypothetical protein PM082_004372 [Marasmius tenuissimus]
MSVSIDKLFGPMLIGALIAAILYGVTSVQTYFYYKSYSNDTKRLQFLVATIWALDTAHVALGESSRILPEVVLIGSFSIDMRLLLPDLKLGQARCPRKNSLVPNLTRLQGLALPHTVIRWILIPLLTILVGLHFVFGIETIVWLFVKDTFQGFQTSEIVKVAAATPFAVSAVLSDVFIAGSLCFVLQEGRSGMHKRTNTLVKTLMIYAVNRCVLTSVVTIAEVAVFTARPNELWFLGIDFVVGKLYANSLLASLNSRNALQNQETSTMSIPSLHLSAGIPSFRNVTVDTVSHACGPALYPKIVTAPPQTTVQVCWVERTILVVTDNVDRPTIHEHIIGSRFSGD